MSTQSTSPSIHGSVLPGFKPLAAAFGDVLSRCHDGGASLHVRVDGEVVADLWGGQAGPGRQWLDDTPTVIFSCTKGLVSIAVGELVRQDLVDLDAPLSQYWPEFTGGGKETVSVGDVLAHKAGVPLVRQILQTEDILDTAHITALLAAEPPFLEPGTSHIYHGLTFGWLAGELVRRVTGASIGTYLRERIAGPLGADAWIGIDPTQTPRVAQLQVWGGYPPQPEAPAEPRNELERYAAQAMTFGGAIPFEFADPGRGFNDPRLQQAEIPGAGGIATARALATIWSATVSSNEQITLLDPATIEAMTIERSAGVPAVPMPPPWPRWGAGFMLTSDARPLLSDRSFGHDGLGGQVGFADDAARVGFGFVTNDLQFEGDTRATDLVAALRQCL
ncbi:MAG TPA: serine hydrolase domain-containing protein [Microbacterium sp.]|uniref:serine hydrolase domain-containing protein n=1 Tax=Microbacterium sp. TaxID=51671 RepID=UPI002D1BAB39|nr:serine hydrolase domain-containing protein [Microbacterium sp.]HWI31988.1 serine hydrolase domain-containing protein [Microbacterium sp.]